MTDTAIDPRAQASEVRSALLSEAARLAEMTEVKPEARNATWKEEIANARALVSGLDSRLTALLRGIEPEPVVGSGPQAGTRQVLSSDRETRSAGEQFIASEQYKQWAGEPGKRNAHPSGSVEATVYSPGTRLDPDLI